MGQQEQMIDANNNTIAAIRRQQDRTQLAIDERSNPQKFGSGSGKSKIVKVVKKEVVNEQGEVVIIEEEEEVEVEMEIQEEMEKVMNGHGIDEKMNEEDIESMMKELDDAANALLNELSDDIRSLIISQTKSSKEDMASKEADLEQELHGLFENDSEEEMKAMMEVYNQMTPWQK